MRLSPGTQLGPYEIVAPIGAGGMGEVYRAHDPRMGRDVAIKVNAESFSARFSREVHAVAALNHSNICHLYDVGPDYLVMELCDGETLAARLKRGKLTMQEALHYAAQIADALSAAHAKGIVHRDLKPGNIMLTKSGVKVLDFGLAKIEHNIAEEQDMETITAKGTILGTMQYMSPEQAQGKKVDARSDIFSFGLVLYEMITGKRAFDGSNPASLIAAILEREAPTLEPEGLNRLVKACLAKDPDARFQTVRDLRRAIEWSARGDGEMPLLTAAPRHTWLAWSVAALTTLGLATVAFVHFREKPADPVVPVRFHIAAPQNAALGPILSLSPDGRKLAFMAGGRLWVHSLEAGVSRDLAAVVGTPFWSPDSRFIGYPVEGKIRKIESTGGPSQAITSYDGRWGAAAWNQDDLLVFAVQERGLFRVPASGAVPVQITALDPARLETLHWGPSFLPDGRHFLYTRMSRDEHKSAIYVGSTDAKPEQQNSKPLLESGWKSKYAPSSNPDIGYLLFLREGTLMAQPFDHRRLELTGQPAPVAERVNDGRSFSVSKNNVLVFHQSADLDQQPTWYDRAGKVLGTVGEPGDHVGMALSPDGARLAVTNGKFPANPKLWLLDLSRGGAITRFTSGSAKHSSPVWSPDGRSIIFGSDREGSINLYRKPADGVKEEELLLKSSEDKFATSWSPDGRFLLYTVLDKKTKLDLWVLPLEGDKKPHRFLNTEFNEAQARLSPDGHWVAYTSDESGRTEIYVRSFSLNSAATATEIGGKLPISNGVGFAPHWRGDGKELNYMTSGGRLMAVEIATNPVFQAGNPQPLGILPNAAWDAARDGKRFLGLANRSAPQPYTVILNWQAGLKK